MNCLTCNKETKNPKFCSRSCAAKKNNTLYPKREPEGLCKKCDKSISSQRLYCSTCFELEIKNKPLTPCPICNKERTIDNTRKYKTTSTKRLQGYCNDCVAGQHMIYNRQVKQKAIDYKGGKCEFCGYNKCNAALEFHHLDPTKKDFAISSATNRPFNDELIKELDKCILLCSNCHRTQHSQERDRKFDDFMVFYNKYLERKCPLSESNGDSA